MSREIARDVSAQQPISPAAQELLIASQVAPDVLESRVARQRGIVGNYLAQLDVMVVMSSPQAMDFDPYVHEEPLVPPSYTGFAEGYDEVRRDPVTKHNYDLEVAQDWLLQLGPTNHLRRKDGIDAAFELTTVAHLLEADFHALPETEQAPERRIGEALIAEELALLWAPTIPRKAQQLPETHKGLVFNAADPNVLSAEQIAELPEKDRWKLVGAQLSDEAAELFQAIAQSPTALPALRLEAQSRSTDMRVKRLNILASLERNKDRRRQLRSTAIELCIEDLDRAAKSWVTPETRVRVKEGKLFELLTLAQKRYELIGTDPTHTVRLALPREDETIMKPIINKGQETINLSVDVIEEDSNGNFVRAYQVKAMTEAEHKAFMAKQQEESDKGKVIYPPARTDMVYLDELGTAGGALVSAGRR